MRIGSFFSGLYLGVDVVLSHGTSVMSSNGKPFSSSAIRTFRAYGLGAALINLNMMNPSVPVGPRRMQHAVAASHNPVLR
jgi:hypothetical protein